MLFSLKKKYVLSYNMQDEIRLLFKGILRLFWTAGTGGLLKLQSSAQPSFKYTWMLKLTQY